MGHEKQTGLGNGADVPPLTPPAEAFELYRHKNADKVRTKDWSGLYWARPTDTGAYEIRSVPLSPGERSTPGGVFPREGFEEHYEHIGMEEARQRTSP